MSENESATCGSPEKEIYIKPLVSLKQQTFQSDDDNEEEIYKNRSKLYRYTYDEEDGGLWKERGVGDVRILKHKLRNTYRLVMRREKTLKLCANHQLIANMELKPHTGNDKAFVWSTPSDCAEELNGQAETLCIRFGKVEGAEAFRAKFEECVLDVSKLNCDKQNADDTEKLASGLASLAVEEQKSDNDANIQKDNNDNEKSPTKEENENSTTDDAKKDTTEKDGENETTETKD